MLFVFACTCVCVYMCVDTHLYMLCVYMHACVYYCVDVSLYSLQSSFSLATLTSSSPGGVFFVQESFALQHASAIFEWIFGIIILIFYGSFAFEFDSVSSDTFMVLVRGGGGGSSLVVIENKAPMMNGGSLSPDGVAIL